ncbi:hypothetical protein FS842_000522 [Serendipita sp. 407]|nr:hypothetical protein FS842_000522 [Serendipita sp. 407]
MARLVALRLLYLSVVLAPHIGLELDPTILSLRAPLLQSLVSTLDFLLQDSHILPKEELVVLSIGIVSSIGSIDNLDLLNFRSMSLVLDTVNMVYRKMKMEGNYMMLSTLLDFAPLTAWLVSKAEVVSNLGASRLISQLVSGNASAYAIGYILSSYRSGWSITALVKIAGKEESPPFSQSIALLHQTISSYV